MPLFIARCNLVKGSSYLDLSCLQPMALSCWSTWWLSLSHHRHLECSLSKYSETPHLALPLLVCCPISPTCSLTFCCLSKQGSGSYLGLPLLVALSPLQRGDNCTCLLPGDPELSSNGLFTLCLAFSDSSHPAFPQGTGACM